MAIAGIILVAKWLAKIKQWSDVNCRLCRRAREHRSTSINILPEETYGHIKSAFCNAQAGEKDKILLAHVQRICEGYDTVMRSYYQQIHGSSGTDTTMLMENIGEQVNVYITHNPFVISCWRMLKTGQSLSKMSKLTALHTECTAQVSEWFNISATDKR